MGKRMRMTMPTKAVLRALSKNPTKPRYGLDIAKEADLAPGTIYPILARLEAAGLLASKWEDIDPVKEGRPRRRHYWLTGDGVPVARKVTAGTWKPAWNPVRETTGSGGILARLLARGAS
jgi:PadR family transcriptional regulator, regulatory protein PadR